MIHVDGTFGVERHCSDWIIQRHVIREQGIVLEGPAPESLIDPITVNELRAAVPGVLEEWWAPQLRDPFRLMWTGLIDSALAWRRGGELGCFSESLKIRITVSVGIATQGAGDRGLANVLSRADQAMYLAKQHRNTVRTEDDLRGLVVVGSPK